MKMAEQGHPRMITPRGNTALILNLVIIEDLKVHPPGPLESADDVEQESGQHDPPRASKFANPYYVDWVHEIQEAKYYAFGNQDQNDPNKRRGERRSLSRYRLSGTAFGDGQSKWRTLNFINLY